MPHVINSRALTGKNRVLTRQFTRCNARLRNFPVLVLLFCALWFILRGDLLYVLPCAILFLCFSVILVLRRPRLGKRELILVFDRFVLVWICRFPLPLDVWERLRFVIVALPGIFFYLFFQYDRTGATDLLPLLDMYCPALERA